MLKILDLLILTSQITISILHIFIYQLVEVYWSNSTAHHSNWMKNISINLQHLFPLTKKKKTIEKDIV